MRSLIITSMMTINNISDEFARLHEREAKLEEKIAAYQKVLADYEKTICQLMGIVSELHTKNEFLKKKLQTIGKVVGSERDLDVTYSHVSSAPGDVSRDYDEASSKNPTSSDSSLKRARNE